VVVEAMKMENELKSPKAGKVSELHAVEGAAVEAGAKARRRGLRGSPPLRSAPHDEAAVVRRQWRNCARSGT